MSDPRKFYGIREHEVFTEIREEIEKAKLPRNRSLQQNSMNRTLALIRHNESGKILSQEKGPKTKQKPERTLRIYKTGETCHFGNKTVTVIVAGDTKALVMDNDDQVLFETNVNNLR